MPEDDVGRAIFADRMAAEGMAKWDAEKQQRFKTVEARLKTEYGLTQDQSLWRYIVGREPLSGPDLDPQELEDDVAEAIAELFPEIEDEVAEAIEELFTKIEGVMAGEPWDEHFPSPEVASVPPPVVKPPRWSRAVRAIKGWLPRR